MYLFIRVNDSLLKKEPFTQVDGKYEIMVNSENALVKKIQEILDVMAADKEVPVLRVAFKGPVPQKCADIVNAISEAYINDYIEEKYTAADTTVTFLDREVNDFSQKLKDAEKSIEGFREACGGPLLKGMIK